MIKKRISKTLYKWLEGYYVRMKHHEKEAVENAMYEYGQFRAKQVTYFYLLIIAIYFICQ